MLLSMTTTAWVGRIGGLAAALGAGAVIGFGTCAAAAAAPADSPDPTSRADTAESRPAPASRTPVDRDRAVRSSAVRSAVPTAGAAPAVATVALPVSTPAPLAATAAPTRRESRGSGARSSAPAPARGLSLPWSDPRGRQITIYKGTHFAIPNSSGLFVKQTVGTGTFTTNSAYDLQDVDQYDWNKFTGIAFTPLEPDRNSAMVGWRFNLNTQEFEIAPFYNVDKKRILPNESTEVISVPAGETFTFDVNYTGITLRYGDQHVQKAYPEGLIPNVWTAARVSGWFGGNEVAPRTVSYYLRLT